MFKILLVMVIMLAGFSARGEVTVDFVGNKVVVYKDGVKVEVKIDKVLINEGASDEIVKMVCKQVKCRDNQ